MGVDLRQHSFQDRKILTIKPIGIDAVEDGSANNYRDEGLHLRLHRQESESSKRPDYNAKSGFCLEAQVRPG